MEWTPTFATIAPENDWDWSSFIPLLTVSFLTGGLLTLIWLFIDADLLVPILTLLGAALFAAATVRFGGGVFWSLLNGYAIGIVRTVYIWVDDWDVMLGDVLKPKFLEVLGWNLWLHATYLIPAASLGFILGAVWVNRQDLRGNRRWIMTRSLAVITVSIMIWILWEYVIRPIFSRPFY